MYCFKVMPFGLKSARTTYQRFVNRMFADQLGQFTKFYINNMLVKSVEAKDHVGHLRKYFQILNQYGMKLNSSKCIFAIASREKLRNIVTQKEIETNPKQIATIISLPSPKKHVQRLTDKIVVLNWFISRLTNKYLPFYHILRGNKHFEWTRNAYV